jgi:hypothetical protein
MTSTTYYHQRRQQLMAKDPHCYWCGKEVIYFKTNGGRVPNNFATIDHLYSKLSGKRFDPKRKQKTLVLACYKCNQERARKEDIELTNLDRWIRGNYFPKWLRPIQTFLIIIWIYKKLRNREINFNKLLNKQL